MPMREALSASALRYDWSVQARGARWSPVSGLFWSREAAAVAAFCAIGLLASIWLMLSFPLSDETATLLAKVL
jgi:hypothetical protein